MKKLLNLYGYFVIKHKQILQVMWKVRAGLRHSGVTIIIH